MPACACTRTRPAWPPQLRRTREVSKLAPEAECLDATALLQLAALLAPPERLLAALDGVVLETLRQVTQLVRGWGLGLGVQGWAGFAAGLGGGGRGGSGSARKRSITVWPGAP